MCKTRKHCFRLKIRFFIFVLFFLFFLPEFVHAKLKYYYLHIGSFQTEKQATQFAQNLQKIGLETVVRGEEIVDRGLWYRIYVGPFYSRLEAELESRDLKEKGITDYAGIHKKESLLTSNIQKKAEPVDKSTKAIPDKIESKIIPLPAEAPPASKPPPKIPLVEKELPVIKRHSVEAPPIKEEIILKKTPPPSRAKRAKKIHPKAPLKSLRKGYGRNTRQGGVALSIKHTYREIGTKVIKRTSRTTSDGSTTTENIILGSEEKDDFPTLMHMTTLQLCLGLTNYLEVFANVGSAFNEPSELRFAYGGGTHLNLFEAKEGLFKGFYSSLQGEYSGGDFIEDYNSDIGNKWKKETEWEEITAKVELGFTRFLFSVYLGGIYFHYKEETKRQQLENLPPTVTSLILQDDIEEENSIGVYGGVDIHLTPALILNLEGQVITQESISLALEYLF